MALILHAATYCRILHSGSRLCRLPSPRLLNASHRLPSRGRRAEHFQPENAVYRRLTRGPALNSFLSYRCLSSVYPRSSAAKLLSLGISLAETPLAVQKTIRAQAGGWEVEG